MVHLARQSRTIVSTSRDSIGNGASGSTTCPRSSNSRLMRSRSSATSDVVVAR